MYSQTSADPCLKSHSRLGFIFLSTILFLLCGCSASITQNPSADTPAFTVNAFSPTPLRTPVSIPDTPTATTSPTSTPTIKTVASITPEPTLADISSMPNPEAFTWQITAEGFNQPVGLVSASDGTGRLFVLEQAGLIRILQDGGLLPDPFLDLRDRVSMRGSTTAGLLGLAFHPRYVENGYFYIHYTEVGGKSVIARYESTSDMSSGDATSELRLLEISFPIGEHKGGHLEFGPDGYLYISVGDGGANGYGDQAGNAQDPSTWLGSILRIDVDGKEPYAIPGGNPFVSGGGLPEVWAYGLRNPWRFTFDRSSNEMYIADVGENSWEEINFLPAAAPGGSNFGWNYLEGSAIYKGQPPATLKLTDPVAQYDHTQGCSVTGGVVYRGSELPEWNGVYLYGDFCQGSIWGLLQRNDGGWENELLHKIPGFITSFGQDEEGEVYLVDLTGKIYELVRLPDN